MHSPTDASPPPLRTATHGSGPIWIATPSSYRTCTDCSLPVSRRTAKDSVSLLRRTTVAFHDDAVPMNDWLHARSSALTTHERQIALSARILSRVVRTRRCSCSWSLAREKGREAQMNLRRSPRQTRYVTSRSEGSVTSYPKTKCDS